MGKIPTGKGMFIYYIREAWNGDMASLADYLSENNYEWIAPKLQDGRLEFDEADQFKLLEELIPELKRIGIDLVGWGYVYGETADHRIAGNWCDLEAAVTLALIKKYNLIAWMVNAESAYKNHYNAADSATKYMDLLKAGTNVPIGLSSYKFPDLHNVPGTKYTFPFKEFLEKSDFNAPQVYWWGWTEPSGSVAALHLSLSQYDKYVPEGMPVIPAGCFRSDDGDWWATPEQITNFNEACQNDEDFNIVGMNYWDLRFSQQREELKEAANSFAWEHGEEPPPIEPPDEKEKLTMKEWIIKILLWILKLFGFEPDDPVDPPPPPPPPPPLPFYIDYMRKAHPDKTDEELSETVWLTCENQTWFYEPIYEDAAKTYWRENAAGWALIRPAKNKDDHEIHPGKEVRVYRWAFPVDAGNAREVVYHIDGLKRMINIKAFSKPE